MDKKKAILAGVIVAAFAIGSYVVYNNNVSVKNNSNGNINNTQTNDNLDNDDDYDNGNDDSLESGKNGNSDNSGGSVTGDSSTVNGNVENGNGNGNANKSDDVEDSNGNKSNSTGGNGGSSQTGTGTINVNGQDVGEGNGNASASNGSGSSTTSGNGNNATVSNGTGSGQGSGSGTGNGTNSGTRYETYSDKVSVQNNTNLSYVDDPTHDYNYNNVSDGTPANNIGVISFGQGPYTLDNNSKKVLNISLNLLNAPYNNKEYCEAQLNREYSLVLSNSPGPDTCRNYPTTLVFEDEGSLNVENHRYTKTASLDFSDAEFDVLGDYYFDVKDKTTDEVVYQLIVTFRVVTDDNNHPESQIYSLVQLKSMATGEKVQNMNISLQNANTAITLEQLLEKDGINENFYLDVIIDGYNNELYSVVDGNQYDKELEAGRDGSNAKIGNHVIINDGENIVNQTYRLTNGGKILIGQGNGQYQIPVGTRYKIVATDNKNYREKYELSDDGEFRVAVADTGENMVTITNVSKGKPNTGLYYTIIPFILLLVAAGAGIVIMKKLSIKDK